MFYGPWAAYGVTSPTQAHFGGPLVAFPGTDTKVYIAAIAFLVSLLVTVVLTVVFRATNVDPGVDETRPTDFTADLGDADVAPELDPHAATHA